MGRARAHPEVACELDDPPRATVGSEAGEDRESSQQRARQSRVDAVDRQTRTAEGGPADFQGKARHTDGPVRYSAPSLIFESADGARLEAGGFQTIEAYDVLIANLERTLERQAPPEQPIEALHAFPGGLATQEVAAIMAQNNQLPDRTAAEVALIELLGAGAVRRRALGDDALWQVA
jgi:hypothetical protein